MIGQLHTVNVLGRDCILHVAKAEKFGASLPVGHAKMTLLAMFAESRDSGSWKFRMRGFYVDLLIADHLRDLYETGAKVEWKLMISGLGTFIAQCRINVLEGSYMTTAVKDRSDLLQPFDLGLSADGLTGFAFTPFRPIPR